MSDRVRFGVLGTANIARKRFMPAIAQSGRVALTAIASRTLAAAEEAARPFSGVRAYGSYEELLASPDVDAVYVALPNALHAPWTKAAADAGKAVLCEKPLARDAREAADVVAYCARRNVPLMEAFMYRFHPQHAYVREAIERGSIGELRFVRSAFTFMLEPFDPKNVRLAHALSGGALMDVGCYCVDAARMLFGAEPRWASAQWDFRPEFKLEVSLAGTLGFDGGRTAIFDCGFRATGQGFYHAAGTHGTIESVTAFVPNPPAPCRIVETRGGTTTDRVFDAVDQYRLEAEAFAAAVVDGTPVPLSPHNAVGTLAAIDALRESAERGGNRVPIG